MLCSGWHFNSPHALNTPSSPPPHAGQQERRPAAEPGSLPARSRTLTAVRCGSRGCGAGRHVPGSPAGRTGAADSDRRWVGAVRRATWRWLQLPDCAGNWHAVCMTGCAAHCCWEAEVKCLCGRQSVNCASANSSLVCGYGGPQGSCSSAIMPRS